VSPTGIVVALHGFEGDPAHLASRLAGSIDPSRWAVLTPRGPVSTGSGPSWFATADGAPDEAGLRDALDDLDALIDEAAAEHDLTRSSVVVGGFSQGGATALALALRHPGDTHPLGGVFSVSGWLPHLETVHYDMPGLAAAGTPVLVIHGEEDEVVPIQQGRSAARLLSRRHVAVQFAELAGDHHLGAEGDHHLRDWLAVLPI
jgi:predicted esterase